MSRFFAVIFEWLGSKRAHDWKLRLDADVLREIVNTLRTKPDEPGCRAKADIQLPTRFQSLARDYQTVETVTAYQAALQAADNQKTLADAEIGLYRCEQAMRDYSQMPEDIQRIADRYGLNGVKKPIPKRRNTNDPVITTEETIAITAGNATD